MMLIYSMVTAFLSAETLEKRTKVNGSFTKEKEEAGPSTKIKQSMKEILSKIKNMGQVNIGGPTVMFTRESSCRTSFKAEVGKLILA